MSDDFHQRPFDPGTITKLGIFELYAQEWIPVFLSPSRPKFDEVHIFDFFSGPGTDCKQTHGSPLRILKQLRLYYDKRLAGWGKIPVVVHFFDSDSNKTERLKALVANQAWVIPNVQVDCQSLDFLSALSAFKVVFLNPRIAKLLIIDQCGVDAVSDEVFSKLISFPTADFIFFLSSSTLHRFRNHPAIKQKIDQVEDSYDVHRVAFDYYQKLIPPDIEMYLGRFSIKKRSNIYGLIFGSHHPLGILKFLQVAWDNDEIAGEANFDIDHQNIKSNELLLPFDVMRPTKIREFESELEQALRDGKMRSEADVLRFCIQAGMTSRHSAPILKQLQSKGVIEMDFRTPDVKRFYNPLPIRHKSQK